MGLSIRETGIQVFENQTYSPTALLETTILRKTQDWEKTY